MRNLGFAAKTGSPGQAALVLLISSEVTTGIQFLLAIKIEPDD